MSQDPIFAPSDFVAVLNQTLDFAYPSVLIRGEVAELRIRKNRWVYFKLVDSTASVSFFGTVQQLSHEVQEGMLFQVRGFPRLHQLYGFSVQVQFMQPVGEGSIKKSADILIEKLKKEGLFDASRKKFVEIPPQRIGLITSAESAAYQDVIKILNQRWGGLSIELIDVHVQGESAQNDIIDALYTFEQQDVPPDAVLITRGGGSAEDLSVFSSEHVTRAVAASSIPTVVAVGHETDVSLAELAADMRASTPSNAAELLVPDRKDVGEYVRQSRATLHSYLQRALRSERDELVAQREQLDASLLSCLDWHKTNLSRTKQIVRALDPYELLQRGYSIIRDEVGQVIRSGSSLQKKDLLSIRFHDADVGALVQSVHKNSSK